MTFVSITPFFLCVVCVFNQAYAIPIYALSWKAILLPTTDFGLTSLIFRMFFSSRRHEMHIFILDVHWVYSNWFYLRTEAKKEEKEKQCNEVISETKSNTKKGSPHIVPLRYFPHFILHILKMTVCVMLAVVVFVLRTF